MSKLTRLRDNIAALKYALTGEGDKSVLNKYTGFGGMTFVLQERPDICGRHDRAAYAAERRKQQRA